MTNQHQYDQIRWEGAPLREAKRALIMTHGRGDTPEGMMQLAAALTDDPDMALIFPAATNNTWYPQSFMAPTAANQPWLDSAVKLVLRVIDEVNKAGIADDQLFIGGWSQGACLALECATRRARRYAGLFAFSGGLIGPQIAHSKYDGNYQGTPVFIGCSDEDFHIPLSRLKETDQVLSDMGAEIDLQLYPGMGHIINEDEIQRVRVLLSPTKTN
jgi:phospholipase/carboxylesterase